MKEFKLNIKVGDEVEVGRFRNVTTKIKAIELDNNGQPVIITNKGAKKLLSCRLVKLYKTSKQLLMEKKKRNPYQVGSDARGWKGILK
jgi:hypothetical protein